MCDFIETSLPCSPQKKGPPWSPSQVDFPPTGEGEQIMDSCGRHPTVAVLYALMRTENMLNRKYLTNNLRLTILIGDDRDGYLVQISIVTLIPILSMYYMKLKNSKVSSHRVVPSQ